MCVCVIVQLISSLIVHAPQNANLHTSLVAVAEISAHSGWVPAEWVGWDVIAGLD